MSNANLPAEAVTHLAARPVREHHALWHLVRARWQMLSPAERADLTARGWRPPRFANQSGAGIDFLAMHRVMIEALNERLGDIGNPAYIRVQGWAPIPWAHNDPDWPMPEDVDADPASKAQATTDFWRSRVAERYENDSWLRQVTLDALGREIEDGIHNWLHNHWAATRWYRGLPGQDRDDPRNDYLASTYSSHVNKHFWKLHGWIDDRIIQWANARGEQPDLSGGWHGPDEGHHHFAMPEDVEMPALLSPSMLILAETFFQHSPSPVP